MLLQVLIFLAAIVVAVPLSKRLGLGSVLGYLGAGMVIGPAGLGLIADVDGTMTIANFGVVLLLFLIGLELQPSRLWSMRQAVFVMGGLQVLGTAAVLALVALPFGLPWLAAALAGIGLALSSTAFALQLLGEKNELTKPQGRSAFGILLFQDLAVIPVLILLPLLGHGEGGAHGGGWRGIAIMAGALIAVVLVGRFLMKPLFRMVASTHSQEVFTATALLVAVGTAAGMHAAGLSETLGAFLAGVLLAESEYRHELEADIEPFKGLLLGLFFISIGMSVRLGLVVESPLLVLGLVVGFVALKTACLFALGKWFLKDNKASLVLAVSISQGGEFAFVLFNLAAGYGIMDPYVRDVLAIVVSLSMATTPILYLAYEKWLAPRLVKKDDRAFDVKGEADVPVVIAGFGRVGQVVARILRGKKIAFTAMDKSAEHIDFIKKFGNKVFYGDAARLDLLRAAKVDKAKVFVLAIDDVEASVRTAETVLQHFPNVTIYARARNRQHAYHLLDLGVKHIMRETFLSSLEQTGEILLELGVTYSETRRVLDRFREHDEELLLRNYKLRGNVEQLQKMAEQSRAELEQIFEKDQADANRKVG